MTFNTWSQRHHASICFHCNIIYISALLVSWTEHGRDLPGGDDRPDRAVGQSHQQVQGGEGLLRLHLQTFLPHLTGHHPREGSEGGRYQPVQLLTARREQEGVRADLQEEVPEGGAEPAAADRGAQVQLHRERRRGAKLQSKEGNI